MEPVLLWTSSVKWSQNKNQKCRYCACVTLTSQPPPHLPTAKMHILHHGVRLLTEAVTVLAYLVFRLIGWKRYVWLRLLLLIFLGDENCDFRISGLAHRKKSRYVAVTLGQNSIPYRLQSHALASGLFLSTTPSSYCSHNTWVLQANPKNTSLSNDTTQHLIPVARQEQPKPDPKKIKKKEMMPTFCLLASKVDHGPGLVRDCDRGDV